MERIKQAFNVKEDLTNILSKINNNTHKPSKLKVTFSNEGNSKFSTKSLNDFSSQNKQSCKALEKENIVSFSDKK